MELLCDASAWEGAESGVTRPPPAVGRKAAARAALWAMYKGHLDTFWRAEEFSFDDDALQWRSVDPAVREALEKVLVFFSVADGIVSENLVQNFGAEIVLPEARCFYGVQNMMENIHAETYARMLDEILDPSRRAQLEAELERGSLKGKLDWARRWIRPGASLGKRLFAFVVVEGLFFSASFCTIYWVREVLPTVLRELTRTNDMIARDEGLHTRFGCALYRDFVRGRLVESEAQRMMREAVELEKQFARETFPHPVRGMNAPRMEGYVEYVADRLLQDMGHSPAFGPPGRKCPVPFAESISLPKKANFFEQEPTEYASRVTESWAPGSGTLDLSALGEDF